LTNRSIPVAIQIAVYLLTLAVLIMLVRDARAIASTVLTAAFLAVLGYPVFHWLQGRKLPAGLAAGAVVLGMLGGLIATGAIITTSLTRLSRRVPFYQSTVQERLEELVGNVEKGSMTDQLISSFEPRVDVGGMLTSILTDLLGVLGNTFLILVIVAFMLVEADSLPAKLTAAFGPSRKRDRMFESFSEGLVRYAGLKTAICFATGLAAGLLTWALSLDVPLLLGFLAFVLNYIPNIGSWIAALPALMLGFVAYGPTGLLLVGIGYLAINVGISNIIEPRIMGRGLGLSPLVIFVALMIFGWMLGPVGVILAIPLVMTVRLALASHPTTEPLAMMMESISGINARAKAAGDDG
jgi:predicted PurR-regulated permease PerM